MPKKQNDESSGNPRVSYAQRCGELRLWSGVGGEENLHPAKPSTAGAAYRSDFYERRANAKP